MPKELKAKIGNDRLELTFGNDNAFKAAVKLLGKGVIESSDDDRTVTVLIVDTDTDVRNTLDTLHTAKIKVESMAIHKPTLDDVFLSLTGKQKEKTEVVEDKK